MVDYGEDGVVSVAVRELCDEIHGYDLEWLGCRVLRLTAYYAQQRVLCVTRTRVLKAVDEDKEIGNNRQ